jgi:hypothetical protein
MLRKEIASRFGITPIISPAMSENQRRFISIYMGDAPHNQLANRSGDIKYPSLRIASKICSDVAKDTFADFKSSIMGNLFLDRQYQRIIDNKALSAAEKCNAGGMVILRPFVGSDEEYYVTISEIESFDVLKTNELDEIIAVVFRETFTDATGETPKYYTLYEKCEYTAGYDTEDGYVLGRYQVTYFATVSDSPGGDGTEINHRTIEPWKNYKNSVFNGASRPWFSVIIFPKENTFERNSIFGVPIFSDAITHLVELDMHAGRMRWELDATEAKIELEATLLKKTLKGINDAGDEWELPKGEDGLYRVYPGDTVAGSQFGARMFNPDPRIPVYQQYEQMLLRKTEDACGVYRGQISDPQAVEKSATEVISSRRGYAANIQRIQEAWQTGLEALITIFNEMESSVMVDDDGARQYVVGAVSDISTAFTWGEISVLSREQEFKERLTLKTNDIITAESVYRWYFGLDDDAPMPPGAMPGAFDDRENYRQDTAVF